MQTLEKYVLLSNLIRIFHLNNNLLNKADAGSNNCMNHDFFFSGEPIKPETKRQF